MNICILGRQSKLALAELEMRYGASAIVASHGDFALVDADIDIDTIGGTIKVAKLLTELETTNPQKVFDYCRRELPKHASMRPEGKIQLGVSLYGFDMPVQKINANVLSLKKAIKSSGRSVRAVPNSDATLSSAQTNHNKLTGPMGMELVFVHTGSSTLLGQVSGVQNIDAYAARDQARPKTDAFVGMLPPKLALMMLNMSGLSAVEPLVPPHVNGGKSVVQPEFPSETGETLSVTPPEHDGGRKGDRRKRVLDPFCGTGVVLQEAALLGFDVYGTDLSEKMVDYSTANMKWLADKFGADVDVTIHHGDAIETTWEPPIDAVVAETYLGQPFSAPPSPEKLSQVRRNCDEIISKFLRNIAPQLKKGTPLCLAVPAWRDSAGRTTHLPLVRGLESLGYSHIDLKHVKQSELLYFREDQVVARQLLLIEKA